MQVAATFAGSSLIWYGILVYLVICILVVWLSNLFASNNRRQANGHPIRAPRDYDNRWPGYPLRLGDYGYDPTTKGKFSDYPAMKLIKYAEDGKEVWVYA